jgi:hypothetical protein
MLSRLSCEQRADARDRSVEALCHFTIDALQAADAGSRPIKLRGEPGAVGSERVQLGRKRLFLLVRAAAPIDCRRKRIKGKCKTPARSFDVIRLGHGNTILNPSPAVETTTIQRGRKLYVSHQCGEFEVPIILRQTRLETSNSRSRTSSIE